MATPRNASFYANFFRAVRSCEPTTYRSLRHPPKNVPRALLPRSGRRAQSTYQNRYGPAATEGLPPPPKPKSEDSSSSSSSQAAGSESSGEPINEESAKPAKKAEVVLEQETAIPQQRNEPLVAEDITLEAQVKAHDATSDARTDSNSSLNDTTAGKTDVNLDPEASNPNRELDLVLSIPSPTELKGKASKHPHLEASPYEHHFDTYSLVQDLASSTNANINANTDIAENTDPHSFSQEQAVTIMKAIRLMLANNLDIAKEGLVSKSDVENESYLFRAACSELRTTLQSSRFAEHQRQRSNRAQLQHEFDILNQKVSQDMMNMREELKGLFNDRKMGLQEEKRKIDSKISELNYEITVLLNSEAKSEVEGLRWVLTRRAALAVGVAAFMTLSALQYYSVKSREAAEVEKKRQAAQKAQEEKMKETESARYTTPSRSSGTQTDGLLEEALG